MRKNSIATKTVVALMTTCITLGSTVLTAFALPLDDPLTGGGGGGWNHLNPDTQTYLSDNAFSYGAQETIFPEEDTGDQDFDNAGGFEEDDNWTVIQPDDFVGGGAADDYKVIDNDDNWSVEYTDNLPAAPVTEQPVLTQPAPEPVEQAAAVISAPVMQAPEVDDSTAAGRLVQVMINQIFEILRMQGIVVE